ncbi:hypothetical protein [Rhodanobacter sp. Soil772]|uniref:hypothetical protein n=1 Tax=Rhodanobacter sp. Soil772 TaxID=1736406 RepID=UPI0009EBD654|nr:hypothetical protein [Rhodanobacter sp. Soil772]
MFNFLVNIGGWLEPRGEMLASRVFEFADAAVDEELRGTDGRIDLQRAIKLPVLFAEETHPNQQQFARVGLISHIRLSGRSYEFQFSVDPLVPPISNMKLQEIGLELGISNGELSRTHWAVKEADLFRTLLRHAQPTRSRPRVFTINDPEVTEDVLVSVMMPFDTLFSGVYASIQGAAEDSGMRCRRADEIWENPAIIQDIVNLIDRAKVVICDCTGRNPNVFYEIGIAHALGREVLLLTQSEHDVPFDLRHLRYISYLNNGEGLQELRERLARRLADLA